MSTKPRLAGLTLLPALLAACTQAGAPRPAATFSRVGQASFAVSRPRPAPGLDPAGWVTAPGGPGQAQARVSAFLQRSGFVLEPAVAKDGGVQLEATRMGAPGDLRDDATCPLQALRRPAIAASELSVRLAPGPAGGTRVSAQARFAEVETKLLSGELARAACRSSGALETAVQAAARGGDAETRPPL